ncbi:hypothetical protein ACIPZF_01335 [Pseudomonas sp. NPDC089752]|uniref:hypothetical protein n=1 Tax=Pseudomonas sp. NPDC089752 TaxID=3364472 RepID=UPI0037F17374
MSDREFSGFDIRVMREGEAVDSIITLLVMSNGFEYEYRVGRIWYWVCEGGLAEIDRKFCEEITDYQGRLVDLMRAAWCQAETEENGKSEYDCLVYSKGPKIRKAVINELAHNFAEGHIQDRCASLF